ncbi:MAG TPA: dTMP kinase [Bacteroidota bacterium]|jgi:dTMP kinase|nr:dTMP kinase [Bacteroidota bacterium]
MFITFEGIDGSGKTTQALLLVERLKSSGKTVVFLREPGGTTVSEKIRAILLDKQHLDLGQRTELLLFSAARAQLVDDVICPAIRSGNIVVCDRFYDSTTAYQGYGRGLNLEDVRSINRIATSGTVPDLTLLIQVAIQEIQRRRQSAGVADDRMESSGKEFYSRVQQGYDALASTEKRVVVVDGMRSAEEIHQDIWNIVSKRLS